MACIWCVLNTTVCVGCVPRLEATVLAPESSVYILYAVYLGTHGTKNRFFVLYRPEWLRRQYRPVRRVTGECSIRFPND